MNRLVEYFDDPEFSLLRAEPAHQYRPTGRGGRNYVGLVVTSATGDRRQFADRRSALEWAAAEFDRLAARRQQP